MRGLTGSHGVLIPKQNVKNLNLSDEIVQAVKDGKFHIYAVLEALSPSTPLYNCSKHILAFNDNGIFWAKV